MTTPRESRNWRDSILREVGRYWPYALLYACVVDALSAERLLRARICMGSGTDGEGHALPADDARDPAAKMSAT